VVKAHINRIATAVPPHEMHQVVPGIAEPLLRSETPALRPFEKIARRLANAWRAHWDSLIQQRSLQRKEA